MGLNWGAGRSSHGHSIGLHTSPLDALYILLLIFVLLAMFLYVCQAVQASAEWQK